MFHESVDSAAVFSQCWTSKMYRAARCGFLISLPDALRAARACGEFRKREISPFSTNLIWIAKQKRQRGPVRMTQSMSSAIAHTPLCSKKIHFLKEASKTKLLRRFKLHPWWHIPHSFLTPHGIYRATWQLHLLSTLTKDVWHHSWPRALLSFLSWTVYFQGTAREVSLR